MSKVSADEDNILAGINSSNSRFSSYNENI